MARVELPESRLRLRKRRRRVRVSLLLVLLVLLMMGAAVGAAYTPALQVRAVSVSGEQTLSSSTIEAFVQTRLSGTYWYILPKSNIFLYPKNAIRSALLAAYPILASADVHAGDFHTIAVNLVERQPQALWCDGQTCLFLDENGVAYGEAPGFSEPVYTVYSGPISGDNPPRQFLSPADFQALSALVDAIVQKVPDEKLALVNVNSDSDVNMSFADGFMLKFALHDAGGDIFERFSLALTSDPLKSRKLSDFEYLDLRFGDKLYYKLR
jgi:cell division septal protein FtsQ